MNYHSLFNQQEGYAPISPKANGGDRNDYKKVMADKKFEKLFSSEKINLLKLKEISW